MKSLKELYRIGPGPSSSHTLGPQRACRLFQKRYPMAHHYEVELYGSLSLTGKGHLTDAIIMETMKPKACLVFFKNKKDLKHPNTMRLIAFDEKNQEIGDMIVYSIGGGAIRVEGETSNEGKDVYPHHFLKDILEYCEAHAMELWEYVNMFDPLGDYMDKIMDQMIKTVDGGLQKEDVLPGDLHLKRIAKELKEQADECKSAVEKEKLLLCAYAYSASEENAGGSITVTAPTLGSSGAAVSMGAAMVAYFRGGSSSQIEYAAEIGIEHHLGLTCDPVGGYVMIPCIERNAVGVLRAMDAAILAQSICNVREHKVSFDMVVNTMNYTGRKIALELKETSLGGLASVVPIR